MKPEYESYGPDTESILRAFTDGINAFIDSRRNDPIEFRLAGFEPEQWRPEDCVQRMAAYGLMSNAASELRIARLVSTLGAEKTTALIAPQPLTKVDPAPSIDYGSLDPDMLRDFIGSDIRVEVPPAGSNNWVVAGSMTTSGKPLLANDPHRTLSLPSLRYLVHLVAPGWNVIGAVEPALPGVAIGHNENIASWTRQARRWRAVRSAACRAFRRRRYGSSYRLAHAIRSGSRRDFPRDHRSERVGPLAGDQRAGTERSAGQSALR